MSATLENLPAHLEPLLQPTPSGVAKLIAVWDGLLVETQVALLTLLPKAGHPHFLAQRVRDKAFASPVPYVRYLTYRGATFYSDDAADMRAKARLTADPDPLVRYSMEEDEWGMPNSEIGDPELFWSLPHQARLAKVRNLKTRGQEIANIVRYAVSDHILDEQLPETELHEILMDYLLKPSFVEYYGRRDWHPFDDGSGEFQAGKDIEALWNIVPKCPAGVAHLLIGALPPSSGMSEGIPRAVVDSLGHHQLETLLHRQDVTLTDLRRRLFIETDGDSDIVRVAAVSWHFSIKDQEFADILNLAAKDRLATLRLLATYAQDLRVCVYAALHDYLRLTQNLLEATFAEDALKRKLADLNSRGEREPELQHLRLYHLARQAAPPSAERQGFPPSGELAFLAECVVPEDTWATFMSFDAKWKSYRITSGMKDSLPRIEGVDSEDDKLFHSKENDAGLVERDALTETRLDGVVADLSQLADELRLTVGQVIAADNNGSETNPFDETLEPARTHVNDGLLAGQLAAKLLSSHARTRRVMYVIALLLLLILIRVA